MSFALLDRIKRHQSNGLYRKRRLIIDRHEAIVHHDGRACINFCSNDYLGLSTHPRVIEAFKRGADRYGVGSGASQLISGHYQPHHELEQAIAEFLNRDAALVFSSGYLANLGVINAITNRKDAIFEDRLNHASLVDGARLTQAKLYRYPHNDIVHLEEDIKRATQANKLIVSDGVFSMSGDLARLPKLADIASKNRALLMIDDAHGLGILGKNGIGTLEHFGLGQSQVPILVNPLGKALGCMGAVVSGDRTLVESLIQFARTYIYNTALSPAITCAALESLKVIQFESWRREKLFYLIDFFKQQARQIGLNFLPSFTHIQSIIVNDNEKLLSISEALLKKGYFLSAIRPPTVPNGTARLRIMLNCLHTEEQIKELLNLLVVYYEASS